MPLIVLSISSSSSLRTAFAMTRYWVKVGIFLVLSGLMPTIFSPIVSILFSLDHTVLSEPTFGTFSTGIVFWTIRSVLTSFIICFIFLTTSWWRLSVTGIHFLPPLWFVLNHCIQGCLLVLFLRRFRHLFL